MATSSYTTSNLLLSPFSARTRGRTRTQFGTLPIHKTPLRRSACIAQFGFNPGQLPDPETTGSVIKDLFGRAESIIYTVADAAVSNSDTLNTTSSKQNSGDWLSGVTDAMESVLKVLKDGLSLLHVPYSYGFAIIMLTVLVKAATFPLTKKQVESAMAMRSLQPQVKAIQQRYAGNQEKIQLETARLYKLAGINPLAGCLPTLATIPVWIGLYRALSNVADEGLLTEGFFWIPSLAGPTTIAARQNGSGISWLFPFVDGHPPLGWSDTLAYLVLPVLLVVTQYISVQIMQSSQSNDPNMKSSQAITKFLPLMIGYFSLSVPSGLSLYWLTNNILSSAQQVWLQKLGGTKNPVPQLNNDVKEEQPQIQKSVSGLSSTKTKALEGEKLTAEGLRPGEKFKQLKEQEARRRRQREEEERAEEGQMVNREPAKEANSFEMRNGAGPESAHKVGDNSASHDSSTSGVTMNGNSSGEALAGGEQTKSTISMEEREASSNHDVSGREELGSPGKEQKEVVEARASLTVNEYEHSQEDTHKVKRE